MSGFFFAIDFYLTFDIIDVEYSFKSVSTMTDEDRLLHSVMATAKFIAGEPVFILY